MLSAASPRPLLRRPSSMLEPARPLRTRRVRLRLLLRNQIVGVAARLSAELLFELQRHLGAALVIDDRAVDPYGVSLEGLQFFRIFQVAVEDDHGEGTRLVVFAEIQVPDVFAVLHAVDLAGDAGHLPDALRGFFDGKTLGRRGHRAQGEHGRASGQQETAGENGQHGGLKLNPARRRAETQSCVIRASRRCHYAVKALIAVASSSFTSNTVYSLVICSRSCTFLVRLSNFSSPPWLRTVVKALTSSPM